MYGVCMVRMLVILTISFERLAVHASKGGEVLENHKERYKMKN